MFIIHLNIPIPTQTSYLNLPVPLLLIGKMQIKDKSCSWVFMRVKRVKIWKSLDSAYR